MSSETHLTGIFTEIGPNLASQINPPRVSFRDFVESCDSTFELELLTTDELRNLVNDIPLGKADGLDGIPFSLLKLSFKFIASSLTRIFNLLLFPQESFPTTGRVLE